MSDAARLHRSHAVSRRTVFRRYKLPRIEYNKRQLAKKTEMEDPHRDPFFPMDAFKFSDVMFR